MGASLYLRCPLTWHPPSTLRLVWDLFWLCWETGFFLTVDCCLPGSTFAQFLSSLSDQRSCPPGDGRRRGAGEIPEGKAFRVKMHDPFDHEGPSEASLHGNVVFFQSLHAMESHVMIKFLPTILNQLFRVLTSATQEDVAVNVTRHIRPSIHPFIHLTNQWH